MLGAPADYADRHPGAADVPCVIEIADSSLQTDRTIKLRIYARAGIPLYAIVNLADRVIEVYTQPAPKTARYNQGITLKRGDRLELPAARGRGVAIPVKQLFS